MSLGDILTKYFGCKHPFLKNPVRENVGGDFERTRYITRNGDKAYGELVGLIYDLAELLPDTFDANEIIEQLDQIVDGEIYRKEKGYERSNQAARERSH